LSGIFPVVEGIIVRPLIQVKHEDIEAYLKKKGLEFCMDESNLDRRYLRNRIRLDLLPYIRENFEPKILTRLSRITSIIREEDSLLEKIAKEKAQGSILIRDNQICLDHTSLSSLSRALRRRIVRDYISRLRGDLRGISFEDVESILSLGEGKEFPLKKNVILRRELGQIFVKRKIPPEVRYGYSWKGKEPLHIKELQWKFEGKRIKKTDSLSLDFDDQTRAFLDFRKLHFPLLVRNRREGDRYQPLGAPGKKKLKEIMRAKGFSLLEREKQPVFFSGNEIVWILGLPVSEKFKIGAGTSDIFAIEKL
jgi:tRNA(Ile)-lysidine synthase